MSLSINTNVISLSVQRHFNSTTSRMNDAMEKMTTGFQINSAADDAAGYGVVKKMESVLSTYDVAETKLKQMVKWDQVYYKHKKVC